MDPAFLPYPVEAFAYQKEYKGQIERSEQDKQQILQDLEAEIHNMNKNYSEGQLSMGLVSFQHEHMYHHLNPTSFAIGPATLTVRYDEDNKSFSLQDLPKEKLRFMYDKKVTDNEQQQVCFYVNDPQADDKYILEEQSKLEKQFQENGNDPIAQLGIQYPPQQIFNAQSCMRKTLESALKIASIVSNLN